MRRYAIALSVALALAGCGRSTYEARKIPPQGMGQQAEVPPAEEPTVEPITGKRRPKPQPPKPPVPVPAPSGKPTRLLLYSGVPDLTITDPRPLGVTEVIVYTDPVLWWDGMKTEADVRAAAAKIPPVMRGMPTWLATWSFDGGNTMHCPAQGSEADWQAFLTHVKQWKSAGNWKGIILDAEQYAPAKPWQGTANMTRRGTEFAQAASPLQVGVAIAFWQVRSGMGVDCRKQEPTGGCLRNPVVGFFDFWKQVGNLQFFNEFQFSPTYIGSAADIKVSLPQATPIPGVWFQASSPSTVMNVGPVAWIYYNPGELVALAPKIKAAMGR